MFCKTLVCIKPLKINDKRSISLEWISLTVYSAQLGQCLVGHTIHLHLKLDLVGPVENRPSMD